MEHAVPSSGRAKALLVVPPFLKYAVGPLLGPAMLAGAAEAAGHLVDVVDLNARWIERDLRGVRPWARSPFVGDHDRDDDLLRPMQRRFQGRIERFAHRVGVWETRDALDALRLDHESARLLAGEVARAEHAWIREQFERRAAPDVVGVSVLYAGQVLWALAVTSVARSLWPGVPVVWGGAHVTALADEIAADARYGVADAFVAGYAEGTFVALLDAIASGGPWPHECFRAGGGEHPRASGEVEGVTPVFRDVRVVRGARPTLPTQLSRGCAYGRCAFCTYPATEGTFRPLADRAARHVIAEAVRRGAHVSFKDSLLTAPLLRRAADLARGAVSWSGCTKLNPALDAVMLRELAAAGCHTLELGLETLLEDAQRLVDKRQSKALFERTLDAAAAAGIALVVNYMTGFPGVDAEGEGRCLDVVRDLLNARRGHLTTKVEHNHFELERRSALAESPPASLTITGSWPWSSVLAWSPSGRRSLKVLP